LTQAHKEQQWQEAMAKVQACVCSGCNPWFLLFWLSGIKIFQREYAVPFEMHQLVISGK